MDASRVRLALQLVTVALLALIAYQLVSLGSAVAAERARVDQANSCLYEVYQYLEHGPAVIDTSGANHTRQGVLACL